MHRTSGVGVFVYAYSMNLHENYENDEYTVSKFKRKIYVFKVHVGLERYGFTNQPLVTSFASHCSLAM